MAEPERVEIKDNVYHISCKVWFTASCATIPISFKFKGRDGIVYLVTDIALQGCEDKNYSGIPSKEFTCTAIIGGLLQSFKLVYFMGSCKWVMEI